MSHVPPYQAKDSHSPLEGLIRSPETRERVRQASLLREAAIRPKVSVNGTIYNNLTHAARETGISARSIKRYALSTQPKHNKIFFI